MSNSAAPTRTQVFSTIKRFLEDNGVVSFRIGWFQPGDEGATGCQFPLAAFMPEPVTPGPTHGGFDTEERIKIALWFEGDGTGPYSETFGGFSKVFDFYDEITSGSKSLAEWFPTASGLGYGSGQFIATLDGWEEYWWTPMQAGGAIGCEMTLKFNLSAGPAQGQSAINLGAD